MAQITVQAVKELLLDALNLAEEYEADEIDAEASLFGDEGLGLDSLDALQLAVAIEEKFGVSIDEEQGQEVFQSVNTVVAFLNEPR
jgi:acyl carrier protein